MPQPDEGFGFAELAQFEPQGRGGVERPAPQTMRELAKTGEEVGYVKREPDKVLRMKRASVGPTTPLYIRLEADDFNRFVRLSADARMGRADFLVKLMDAYQEAKGRGRG